MSARVLLIDNYDSFTWNLAQALQALGATVDVLRADDPALPAALASRPDRLVISPGPGRPEEAGDSVRAVRDAPMVGIPTLGVCLGLQCAAVAFGARVVRAPEPRHGKTSIVHHDGRGIFTGVPEPTVATRYHSLMVDEATLPAELVVSARSDDGVVMAMRHAELPLEAVQFHPESVLSQDGVLMLANFLEARAARPLPEEVAP
ncbi:MAG: aminodeoxychorismate/anthranilate synthase component II [Chloroflexota bacterium]|nr:aminodeoxychorismate/anthranilate synthase component II [Chloroflexota bacterium]